SLDSTVEGYYKPKVGEQALQVVRNINMITVKAENAKEVAASKNDEMVQQLIKLNENFEKEFEGFKSERDNDTQSWETTDYYYVKKGNLTKKYPKIKRSGNLRYKMKLWNNQG